MVTVVISGKPGSGSSTVAKLLAKKLNLKHFSVGDYNKAHAKKAKDETDKSLEMWKLPAAKLRKFHIQSDNYARKIAKKGNIVIDAKLGIRMLKGLYNCSIWLTAPSHVRTKRYAERGNISLQESRKKLIEKDNDERRNWKKIYGFDSFSQEKNADMIIDTSKMTPDEITDTIIAEMPRVFIVHRWLGTPKADWYPSAKKELEKKGYVVIVLKMPHTSRPTEKDWVPVLAKAVGKLGNRTILVGHSAGVMTILRYLETLKSGRIGGCVFVAGWVDDLGYKELSNFFTKPINWAKIRKHCSKFTAIHSDDDPYVKMYHGEVFRKKLGAKLIVEHKKGHMDDDTKVKKLPSVVRAIEKMSK